ncbi:MAG TPA: hypothetical protein VE863_04335 [Pyrinomonadaceae bacterium]|nr:hypothetical protein [Pyrinomonadaceae bacterium]
MFACIFCRTVSKEQAAPSTESENPSVLVDLAFTFSPLVERTRYDTVVFDISGQDLLFPAIDLPSGNAVDSSHHIGREIAQEAASLNLDVNISIAANPNAAIHAARSFQGITFIDPGRESVTLASISIKQMDYSLAAIEADHEAEIQETFRLWGIRTFADLARLPLPGVAERLGPAGVRLQELAQGKSDRNLNLVRPPIGFGQSLELEHAVTELEPLSFILSRLLNQLCANLNEYGLATNELRLRLFTERHSEYRLQSGISDNKKSPTEVGTLNAGHHERILTLPVPMRNPKTLLRLLLFDVEAHPPPAAVVAVAIKAEPMKPQAAQTGLFVPLAPEPEKLEITLGRLAKLVGAENVGSPELLDTHRPDAFRMKRFALALSHRGHRERSRKKLKTPAQLVLGFRVFRPPLRAEVRTLKGQPARIDVRAKTAGKLSGQIIRAAGPWRGSGDWWRADVWARDEWDVAVIDPHQTSEVLCRIYRDLTNEEWFVAGIYD